MGHTCKAGQKAGDQPAEEGVLMAGAGAGGGGTHRQRAAMQPGCMEHWRQETKAPCRAMVWMSIL